jgi:hypothetical protein
MNLKFKVVEYVQADEVGIDGVFEPKVGELDQTRHPLQVLNGLAFTLGLGWFRHSVFLSAVAVGRSADGVLAAILGLFLDELPGGQLGPGVERGCGVGRHDSNN